MGQLHMGDPWQLVKAHADHKCFSEQRKIITHKTSTFRERLTLLFVRVGPFVSRRFGSTYVKGRPRIRFCTFQEQLWFGSHHFCPCSPFLHMFSALTPALSLKTSCIVLHCMLGSLCYSHVLFLSGRTLDVRTESRLLRSL